VTDHFRPYGVHSKHQTPPYYVEFPDGHAGWYDANEVERASVRTR
jgi:hypothetical protein